MRIDNLPFWSKKKFTPKSLFTDGSQGVRYEPNDINKYMAGLGSELISNGTFETTTGRTAVIGTISAVGGRLRIARAVGNIGRASIPITCQVGKTYTVSLERYKMQVTQTQINIAVLASSSAGAIFTNVTGVDGFYTFTFIATQTTHWLFLEAGAGTDGQYAEYDNVSIKEIPNIALCTLFQDSAGMMPVTSVEQPVGLMLDKSKNLTMSAELYSGGNITGVPIGGPAFTNYSLGVNVEAGKSYEIVILVSGYSGSGTLNFSGASGTDYVGNTTIASNGYWSVVYTALTTRVLNIATRSTNTANFSNISVKELYGKHAYQSTATSRPILSARYNLFDKTEDFNSWVKNSITVDSNVIIAPNGELTADRLTFTNSNISSVAKSIMSMGAHTMSIWAKTEIGTKTFTMLFYNATDGSVRSSEFTATTTWQKFSFTGSPTISGNTSWYISNSLSANVGSICIWGADLRASNNFILPYQRVNTSTDYDTVGFPCYLSCDGVDDGMQTTSLDLSSTNKLTLATGLRVNSTTGVQIPIEFSTSYATNLGAFELSLNEVVSGTFAFANKRPTATHYKFQNVASGIRTVVFAGDVDGSIASAITGITFRENGAIPANIIASGNETLTAFGNYPLFLFRRSGTSATFNGRFYGLVLVGKKLTTSNFLKLEKYLNSKTRAYV